MTLDKAISEAQKRANATCRVVLVVYFPGDMSPDWRMRYRAVYASDYPSDGPNVKAEVSPSPMALERRGL